MGQLLISEPKSGIDLTSKYKLSFINWATTWDEAIPFKEWAACRSP